MQGVLLGSKHFVGKDGTPWSIYYVCRLLISLSARLV